MTRGEHLLGGAALSMCVLSALAMVRCSAEGGDSSPAATGGSGGAGLDATPDRDAAEVTDSGETAWLPLEPLGVNGEHFPEGPSAPSIDCNPWCTAVIPVAIDHPAYYGFSFDERQLVDGDLKSLYLLDVETGKARLVAKSSSATESIVQPHVHGRYVSYLRSEYPRGRVEVIDLIDKRKRVVDAYEASEGGLGTVVRTAVNATHALWITSGALYAADLQTGEKKALTPAIIGCDRQWTTDTQFLCSTTSKIASVDPVAGSVELLAPAQALQTDGICSPDKRQVTWVDYRDPPGEKSTYDGDRNGGEVYLYDTLSKALKRVTHDSPDKPKAKSFPAVEGNLVVWRQMPSDLNQNPPSAQDIYAGPSSLWKLDLSTGKKCYTDSLYVSLTALIRGKLYTVHVNGKDGPWLVAIDMNHPSISWTCPP